MDLPGKVAVVTGASRGLGRAFAESLVAEGTRVFGLARSEDDLSEVGRALGEAFVPVACDVADQAAVDAAFARVKDEVGRLDILLNNAGLGRFGPVDELDPEDWHRQMDTNLSGLYYGTRAAIPLMEANDPEEGVRGHIVNIASVAGLVGNANLAAYNATKFGVRGFSDATMKELRPRGLRVTCVYPGSVDTHFAEAAGTQGNPGALHAEDVAETVLHVLRAPGRCLISEVVLRPMVVGG